MSKLRILLAEDDENLGILLKEYLQAKEFDADLLPDGEKAMKSFKQNGYDLCILDVMMPIKDGFTVAKEIRESNKEIPIIFLTAKSLKDDVLHGFKLGGDDYITKPIKPTLLVSKVNSLLRRLKTANESTNIYEAGDLKINRENYMVYRENQEIQLARKEFELLNLLASKPHKVFTRDEIMNQVWDDDIIVGERTIDVHIRKIREKTGIDHIKTIKGVS